MEFKQITITNFLSYFGENTVTFSDMTTVILGQNTSGKSKFFDAINWVLFERIYNTDIYAWVTDKQEISQLILNKKYIKDSISEHKDELEASVRIIITDGINDISVLRNYYYTLDENGRHLLAKKFFLWQERNELGEVEVEDYDEKAELRILEKFPIEIRDFFLFQGEAASQILKLHKGSKFTSAVKKIARLETFELAKNIAEKFYTTSKNIIKKQTSISIENQQKQNLYNLEIENLKQELEKQQNNFDKASEAKADYQVHIDQANDFLSSQKDFEELFEKKQKLEEEQKEKIRMAKTLREDIEITDSWVFFKILDKIQNFENFYKALETKAHVPAPIPQNEILQALKDCKCPICETTFKEEDPVWKIIESKKTKNDTDSLAKELNQLHYCMMNACSETNKVPADIENYYQRTMAISEERKRLTQAINSLKNEIDNIRITETDNETRQKIQDAQQKLGINQRALKKAEDNITIAKYEIEKIKGKIEQKEKESLKLAASCSKGIPDKDIIQLYYSYQLTKAMEKLCKSVNDLALSQIQKTANQYYKEMTKENPSFVGELKINFEDSDIYTENSNGQRIYNINQANRISIQLAVIAGILTVASNQFGEQYPFITDAPISDLGGKNKIPTIRCMIDAFEQSILILKDDSTEKNLSIDEVRKLIQQDKNIGYAYELTIEPNEDVDMQYTKITKIKG